MYNNLFSKLKFYTMIGFISFYFLTFSPKIISLATSLRNKQAESSIKLHKLCKKDRGSEDCPKAAFIWKVLWDRNNQEFSVERIRSIVRYFNRDFNNNELSKGANRGQLIYDDYLLTIEGLDDSIGTLLRFSRTREQLSSEASSRELQEYSSNYLIKGYLAAAGFSLRSKTTYKYPCTVAGSLTIGIDEETGCDEVKYNPALRTAADYIRRNADPKQNDGAPVLLRQYCSVLATSISNNSNAWSTKIGDIHNISSEKLCNQAIKECKVKAGGECVVVEHGYWRTYHPMLELRKVRLLFRCEDSAAYDKIIAGNNVIEEWKKIEKKFQQNSSCIFSVYNPDDVLIKLDRSQHTLIHTDDDNAQVNITTLVGKVAISLPGNQDQVGTEPDSSSQARTLEIEAGERFSLDLSTLDDSEKTLSNTERKAVLDLPVIQAFLKESNWEKIYPKDEIESKIIEYQKALNEQFLSPIAINSFFTIVDSYKNKEEAEARKTEIQKNNPDLEIQVFRPYNGNPYYGVMASSWTSREKALEICIIAKERGIAPDAYVWTFSDHYIPCNKNPSAVQVERTTVDGVNIWKTEIDLNNPNTIVTLVKTADVEQAGGFTQFAKNSKAALIASGTFSEDTNWTMISEGNTIQGEDTKNWSTGTVFGLKTGNQAEMFARPDVPEWNEYWFALTGHPRLVSGGNPGITEVVSAPDEDFIKGDQYRAAIGFSSKEKKLYHIVTNDPIPLNRLAKIMHLIGCDQAMNLEGGGGMVLACKGDSPECNGTPLVSGEVRSPLIVVYDAQHRDERITQAWELFQASDRLP
ncbi:MAG: hypothetical protein F6K36_25765 [Symploca sp. SIO3C6]|nr:hypothetical protein [Symploca sp. SIO3C6]